MSNAKPQKATKPKGIPNRHLHARTTFLYQAATYLTLQTARAVNDAPAKPSRPVDVGATGALAYSHSPIALQLGSDLQQVSRKAQLRLAVNLKRTMCKSCNSILVPGATASQSIENHSKESKKSWADILVVQCRFCSSAKRFPVGSIRQLKKSKRGVASRDGVATPTPDEISISNAALLTEDDQTPHTD